jgi:hypothetical protein
VNEDNGKRSLLHDFRHVLHANVILGWHFFHSSFARIVISRCGPAKRARWVSASACGHQTGMTRHDWANHARLGTQTTMCNSDDRTHPGGQRHRLSNQQPTTCTVGVPAIRFA